MKGARRATGNDPECRTFVRCPFCIAHRITSAKQRGCVKARGRDARWQRRVPVHIEIGSRYATGAAAFFQESNVAMDTMMSSMAIKLGTA